MGGYAWVTLATNDSYSLGALVLAHSLKQVATREKLVVLITPGVTPPMRTKLAEVFDIVQEVNILDSKDESNLKLLKRPELGVTFTKLHCWRLTQFEKCVFLDADTLVLENCDELFEREEFSAAPDIGWPDCFNSGVFVFRPSNITYDKLIRFALEKGSFDGGDQGLLNLFFSDWAHGDITKHLPFIYNMSSTATYSYLPAFKQFGSKAKIIHFLGATKPWLQYFDTESRTVHPSDDVKHLQGILQHWWNIFCNNIHPTLSPDMAGMAGAFAKLSLGVPRTPEQAALDDHLRRQGWEVGNIDYLGRDSFDNIWSKICQTLSTTPDQTATISSGEVEGPESSPKAEISSPVCSIPSEKTIEFTPVKKLEDREKNEAEERELKNVKQPETSSTIEALDDAPTSSISMQEPSETPSIVESQALLLKTDIPKIDTKIESKIVSPPIPEPSACPILPEKPTETPSLESKDPTLSLKTEVPKIDPKIESETTSPPTKEEESTSPIATQEPTETPVVESGDSVDSMKSTLPELEPKFQLKTASPEGVAACPISMQKSSETHPKVESKSPVIPLKTEVSEKTVEIQSETVSPFIKPVEEALACPISMPKPTESSSKVESKCPEHSLKTEVPEEKLACPISTQKPTGTPPVVEMQDTVLPLKTEVSREDSINNQSKTACPPMRSTEEAPACQSPMQKLSGAPPVLESQDPVLPLKTEVRKEHPIDIQSKTTSLSVKTPEEASTCPESGLEVTGSGSVEKPKEPVIPKSSDEVAACPISTKKITAVASKEAVDPKKEVSKPVAGKNTGVMNTKKSTDSGAIKKSEAPVASSQAESVETDSKNITESKTSGDSGPVPPPRKGGSGKKPAGTKKK